MTIMKKKILFSSVFILLIIIRLKFPQLSIDIVTISLLLVAAIPWFTNYIESASFPGGLKVKLKDIKDDGEKVTSNGKLNNKDVKKSGLPLKLPTYSYLKMSDKDPNLALVGLGIEVEKRLRELGDNYNSNRENNLYDLIENLYQEMSYPPSLPLDYAMKEYEYIIETRSYQIWIDLVCITQ